MIAPSSERDSVDIVERRIERRRELLKQDWQETRAYVAHKNRLTPVVAVALAATFGFGMARRKPFHLPADRVVVVRRSGFRALVAMMGGALRIVTSPAGRAIWEAWRRGSSRPR
ncbi:MAG: hypothetical protein ABI724_04145 [Betaproteobacteria bacterium]